MIEDQIIKFFRVSKWKTFIGLMVMCGFEYMSIKILIMPYSELDANSDKYHPIVAYVFFGSLAPLVAILIVIYLVFLFRKGRGLYLTSNGFIDHSTPFSIGEIPFERILQICNSINNVTKFRGIKIRDNKLSIALRGRKVDKAWWEAKNTSRIKSKKYSWFTRFGSYHLNTKIFSASHNEIAEAVEKHIELEPRIKIYTMDVEQTFRDLKKKRKAEKKLLKEKKGR